MNKGNEIPRRVIFFDTETKDKKINATDREAVFNIGWACYWDSLRDTEEWFYFETKKKFWDFVLSKTYEGSKLVLVAHNIAFDFRVLDGFTTLLTRGYSTNKVIFKGVMNIYQFSKRGRSILCLDNMNFFSGKLAKLGENVGLPKLDMKRDDLRIYCRRDVEIMLKAWRLLFAFLKDNDLGNFAPTIARQALNAFTHRFMKHGIYIHNSDKAVAAERESYHGGRVECFRLGKQDKRPYFMLDVVSMYPSMMYSNNYPTKLKKKLNKVTRPELTKLLLKGYGVIADVSIMPTAPAYAVKRDGKLLYPMGKFDAWLTTRELERALARDEIISIRSAFVYEMDNIFRDYVEFFFGKKDGYKKDGNESFAYLCKIYLNSLYGKFGQKIDLYEDIGTSKEDGFFEYLDLDNDKHYSLRSINHVLQRRIGVQEGYDSFVAIPSHITADARLKLWEYIEKAGRDNVYYCDTDSLIVNDIGRARLKREIGSSLGQLEVQEQSDKLTLHGLKDYVFGSKRARKGIRDEAEQLDTTTFRQDKFEGLAGAIRNNRLNKVIISKTVKHLTRNYDKGTIKGSKVSPFIL